jgi:hypothetical protein
MVLRNVGSTYHITTWHHTLKIMSWIFVAVKTLHLSSVERFVIGTYDEPFSSAL